VFVDIDGPFGAAEFPECGVFPLVGEEELAALIEDAPDDHGEGVADPGRGGLGVEGAVEADVPGEVKQGGGGAVFLGGENFEGVGVVLGQDVVAEGGLDVEESGERQAGEAPELLVFDLAVNGIAEGGAQDADRALAVALDLEVDGASRFDGSKVAEIARESSKNVSKCMATFETSI